MFFPNRCIDGVKEVPVISSIQIGWKDYQGVIHNTYHCGNIEIDHHVICSMPEDVEKHFATPNLNTPMSETLRKVLCNSISQRDKISLNGLGMKKVKLEVYL